MKKLFLAAVLIGTGCWVAYLGHRRAESIVGVTAKVGADIANAFDGNARQPDYLWYYVGGGALVAVGLVTLFRRGAG